jgi:hypothetical protein
MEKCLWIRASINLRVYKLFNDFIQFHMIFLSNLNIFDINNDYIDSINNW